jgi:hypothetical protein
MHWHEHHFPEHVEQKEIQRSKHADHAGFEKQHENEVFLQPRVYRPGCENGQWT